MRPPSWLVGVQDEAGEGAVFVVVASVRFAAVQFDVDLVPGVQVQHGAVAGVVIVLVSILSDGAGPHLQEEQCVLFTNVTHICPNDLKYHLHQCIIIIINNVVILLL